MNVILISECQKNAFKNTKKILDMYAERIGSRTWKTSITEDGLQSINELLKKTASKNTSVVCHRIKTRNTMEVMWIVGNKNTFDEYGKYPTNITHKKYKFEETNNNKYFKLIKALSIAAALFHDFGKLSISFQKLLRGSNKNPLRHEFVSGMILNPIFKDKNWIENISNKNILNIILHPKPLEGLEPFEMMVVWLSISHHIKPGGYTLTLNYNNPQNFDDFSKMITKEHGYVNKDDYIEECYKFEEKLPIYSEKWLNQFNKYKLLFSESKELMKDAQNSGAWVKVLEMARICLILGDHDFSSQPANEKYDSYYKNIYANTYNDGKLKQKLDEHLCGVTDCVRKVVWKILKFNNIQRIQKTQITKEKTNISKFKWQDKTTKAIETNELYNYQGGLIFCMSSTGTGKTRGVVKILNALSKGKGLCINYTLPLRSLTLQTGTEMIKELKFNKNDVGVFIGSKESIDLYEKNKENKENICKLSNSSESSTIFDGDYNFFQYKQELAEEDDENNIFISSIVKTKKESEIIQKPIIVCTIDHLIGATEGLHKGRFIVPILRAMVSDLIIDEIDNYSISDQWAILRLIELYAMFGRKVIISSASLTRELSNAIFKSYESGYKSFCVFSDSEKSNSFPLIVVDEHEHKIEIIKY